MKNKTYNKKKMLVVFSGAVLVIGALLGRLVYLMVFDAEYYQKRAEALHEREREIKAARGEIVDRNGMVLATNKTVCTISVIHSQIEEPKQVIAVLSKELEMEEEEVIRAVSNTEVRNPPPQLMRVLPYSLPAFLLGMPVCISHVPTREFFRALQPLRRTVCR